MTDRTRSDGFAKQVASMDLYRLTTDGSTDTTFGTSGQIRSNLSGSNQDAWYGIEYTFDGKLILGGSAGTFGSFDFALGRYSAGGSNSYGAGVHMDQRLWAQQDANFNVTSISNDAGAVVERYVYTPYGKRTVLNDDFTLDSDNLSDFGFDLGHQGLRYDAETGLVYNRARYLHVDLGRFISRDPLGYVDGMSVYQYVRSRPFTNYDPSGLGIISTIKDIWRDWTGGDDDGSNIPTQTEVITDAAADAADAILEDAAGVGASGTVAGAATSVINAGATLPCLVRPKAAKAALEPLNKLTQEGKDFIKDPLYQALQKMANGAKMGDLKPAEQKAMEEMLGKAGWELRDNDK